MNIVFVPNFKDRPGNPGRCIIPAERIEINESAYSLLPDEQKEFVLYHEMGHCKYKTYDECMADDYALQQMALKKPYSLINHYKAVKAISHNNKRRVNNAAYQTLKISAKEGSETARQLLHDAMPYANADGTGNGRNASTYLWIVLIIILTVLLCYWIQKK